VLSPALGACGVRRSAAQLEHVCAGSCCAVQPPLRPRLGLGAAHCSIAHGSSTVPCRACLTGALCPLAMLQAALLLPAALSCAGPAPNDRIHNTRAVISTPITHPAYAPVSTTPHTFLAQPTVTRCYRPPGCRHHQLCAPLPLQLRVCGADDWQAAGGGGGVQPRAGRAVSCRYGPAVQYSGTGQPRLCKGVAESGKARGVCNEWRTQRYMFETRACRRGGGGEGGGGPHARSWAWCFCLLPRQAHIPGTLTCASLLTPHHAVPCTQCGAAAPSSTAAPSRPPTPPSCPRRW
jgi:hypothetical protein